MARRQRLVHVQRRLRGRPRHGPAHVVALGAGHAQVADYGELVFVFDAFGDHAPAKGAHHAQQRAQDLQPARTGSNATHQRFVDLDELRRQVRQQIEVGMPGAEIIQRVLHAELAQHRHRLGKAGRIADRGLFGDFDHQARWRNARFQQRRHQPPALGQQVPQCHGAEIEEELAGQVQAAPGGQRGARRVDLQRHGRGNALRQPEQRVGVRPGRARRAPDQRLVAKDFGIVGLHDRLEYRVQRRQPCTRQCRRDGGARRCDRCAVVRRRGGRQACHGGNPGVEQDGRAPLHDMEMTA
ncbi:hypothetical protein D9M72_321300 [compost metagenome]